MSAGRFVILAAPRTGSNLLCTLLNGHPEIVCHHEVFNPQGIFVALDQRGVLDLGTVEERDRDPLGFLDRLWLAPPPAPRIGFKMTRGQCPEVVARVLEDRGIQKIVLRRRNRLKTYVSVLIAERTGRWEAYAEDDLIEDRPRVRVEPEELRALTELNERFYADILGTLEGRGQTCLEVLYERLFEPREQSRLLGFLGVEPRGLEPASVKQNPRDLRELILNFSDLEARLRGTSFQEELRDLGD